MAERTSELNPVKVVSERRSVKEMDDLLGGMFKLTGSNYSVWKSKMMDMLVGEWEAACAEEGPHDLLFEEKEPAYERFEATQ